MKLLYTAKKKFCSLLILPILSIIPNMALALENIPQEILDQTAAYQGISIRPLDQHTIPQQLKANIKEDIEKMNSRGYIDATKSEVSMLDRAKKKGRKYLKPLNDLLPNLAIRPAELNNSEFTISGAKLLGAMATGGLSNGKATGIFRLFAVPKLGLIGLSEIDYVENHGGMIMIEESINHEINGQPAVLLVKKSQEGKGYSELKWPTDEKIFTLTTNRAIIGDKSINNFLEFARSIQN